METDSTARYLRRLSSWSYVPQNNGKTGAEFLKWMSSVVYRCRGKSFPLERPTGAVLTIGNVQDTIYRDRPDEVKAWGEFYLKDQVNMTVVGSVEGASSQRHKLVLMTCEDEKIYAYDGEELHVVAPGGLRQLRQEGIEFPASESYSHGDAFKDMSDKDWDKFRKGPIGTMLDQEHRKVVTANKSRFMQSLKNIRMRRTVPHPFPETKLRTNGSRTIQVYECPVEKTTYIDVNRFNGYVRYADVSGTRFNGNIFTLTSKGNNTSLNIGMMSALLTGMDDRGWLHLDNVPICKTPEEWLEMLDVLKNMSGSDVKKFKFGFYKRAGKRNSVVSVHKNRVGNLRITTEGRVCTITEDQLYCIRANISAYTGLMKTNMSWPFLDLVSGSTKSYHEMLINETLPGVVSKRVGSRWLSRDGDGWFVAELSGAWYVVPIDRSKRGMKLCSVRDFENFLARAYKLEPGKSLFLSDEGHEKNFNIRKM